MNFEDLTEEQKKKVRECKTPEGLLALAKEEGYELSDEELEAVAGGAYIYCEVKQCESF
ncbi:MAG: Nif11-like leader peptide family natural product precursor [Eggerthellaceae bacterium]|nr:Nif11-like leader peptide family natural product precursor [Eggerthellaceae bacterium]